MVYTQVSERINPHLMKERKNCTFDIEELTNVLDGGKQYTEERRDTEIFFIEDTSFQSPVPLEYLSHKEKYEEAIRILCLLIKRNKEYQKTRKPKRNLIISSRARVLSLFATDGYPLLLHFGMFIPTLAGQASPKQQKKWLEKAQNLEIIGTYAQTELGHGTFIRGLETTATYDPKTEEFILNSPTLTSYKWWPGGLGQTANYAVVVAQLYTKGKCEGISPFIVQIRDEKTHIPLPGIKVGEIGCKLGMNMTNNGYLGFENFRIPRTNMLMKNNQVLSDGTFVTSSNRQLTYGTMVLIRMIILQDSTTHLQKAVTIATRYSAVRHQSEIHPNKPEPQIIDFVTQQYKIIPQISTAIAFHFTADLVANAYQNVMNEVGSGNLRNLPELHATTCVLKVIYTVDAAEGIETLRLACGGHGYMTSSNLPQLYGLVTAMITYEGEKTVLLLQTARFLIKLLQNKTDLSSFKTVKYLETALNINLPFSKTVDWIISVIQQVAARKINAAHQKLTQRVKSGQIYQDAWNNTSIELVEAAELHGRTIILETFATTVKNLQVSQSLKVVLNQLLELYAVYTALKLQGHLLKFTNTLGSDIDALQTWLEELLAALRPNAVGLVDSFEFPDEILKSALGAYDGNVYERLYAEAQKSPLNQEPVNKSFQDNLKAVLKSNL